MAFLPLAAAGMQAGLEAYGTHLTNQSNARIAQKQMDFQENMSSTAYQRAMADMEQAGLNPILAGNIGGASTSSGSSYQAQNVLGSGVSTAREASRAIAEIKNLNEQNLKIQADTTLAKAQTRVAQQMSDLTANNAHSVDLDNKVKEVNSNIEASDQGVYMNWLNRLVKTFNPLSGIMSK